MKRNLALHLRHPVTMIMVGKTKPGVFCLLTDPIEIINYFFVIIQRLPVFLRDSRQRYILEADYLRCLTQLPHVMTKGFEIGMDRRNRYFIFLQNGFHFFGGLPEIAAAAKTEG